MREAHRGPQALAVGDRRRVRALAGRRTTRRMPPQGVRDRATSTSSCTKCGACRTSTSSASSCARGTPTRRLVACTRRRLRIRAASACLDHGVRTVRTRGPILALSQHSWHACMQHGTFFHAALSPCTRRRTFFSMDFPRFSMEFPSQIVF